MTNSTDDRLSRIEAIIEANATAIAQLQQTMDSGFEQTRQRTAELQQTMGSGFEQTRQRTAELQQTMGSGFEQTQETISQLQQTMDSGFEQTRQRTAELQQTMDSGFEQTRQVIEREATEAISLISGLAEHQEETDIRFNNLLQEARADRQRNENEHQAFRESFQNMLAEIARIWQRLAG